MAVTPAQQTAVNHLYIALFNRAPDAAGFAFWTQALSNGASLATITSTFLASPEARTIYPSSQTSEQFVSAFYQTVFGRAADANGLAFWEGVLNAAGGAGSDAARSDLVWRIVGIVATPLTERPANLSDTQYAQTVADRGLFGKKAVAGLDFVTSANSNDLTLAKLAITFLDAPSTPAPTPTPVDTTLRLTTSTDTLVGGAGNDTFDASPAGGSQTLSTADTLDGGAGNDTLNVTLVAGGLVAPVMNSIESVILRATVILTMLDLASSTGVTSALITGSTFRTAFANVGNARLSVADQSTQVEFKGSTATAVSLTVTNVGSAGGLSLVGVSTVAVGGATSITDNLVMNNAYIAFTHTAPVPVSTVSIAATGSNAFKSAPALTDSLETIAVTGAGSVDFSGSVGSSGKSLSSLKTLTVGDGGVIATIEQSVAKSLSVRTGAGVDSITVNGGAVLLLDLGAGNDIVKLTGSEILSGAEVRLGAGDDTMAIASSLIPQVGVIIDGGTGTDTLSFSSSGYGDFSLRSAPQRATITGFETLTITDRLTNGMSIDVSKLADAINFVAADGVETTATASVTGLSANASVTLSASLPDNGTLQLSHAAAVVDPGVLTLRLTGSYTENNDATSTPVQTLERVSVTGVESVHVIATGTPFNVFRGDAGTVADAIRHTLTLTDDALKTLSISGDQRIAISTQAAQTQLTSIDATALTGQAQLNAQATSASALTIKGSLTAANTITGGSFGNTIIGGSLGDTIIGGAAVDVLEGGAGVDILTGGAGNDTFRFASRSDTRNSAYDASNTSPVNIDRIVDFAGNGGLDGDRISLSTTADAYGSGLQFTTSSSVQVGTVIIHSGVTVLGDIGDIINTSPPGPSSNAIARIFDVEVIVGSLAGRYLIINDDVAGITTDDMIISITGVTGRLNEQDFVFSSS